MSFFESTRRTFIRQTAGALAGVSLIPESWDALPVLQGPTVKVALIGVGRHGRAIIAELQKIKQVEISAICDASPTRLAAAADQLKGLATYANHLQLLEARADVTAMIVATPTHIHRQIVEDCLSAGRHVYCEAPIASTVDDCVALQKAAAGSGKLVVQAGFQGRSNPTYRRAQPLVDAELRELVSMHARHARKVSWRFPSVGDETERAANWRLDPEVSTGLAGEFGAQQFDVAHWFRGSYPVSVTGRGGIRLHSDGRKVADSIELDLLWAEGPALRYEATLASSYGGTHEQFLGTQGTIRLAWSHGWLFKEPDAPTQGWEVYATRQQAFGDEGIVLVADATKLAAQGALAQGAGLPHPSLYYALVDFVRSVTEGTPVRCTMQEGARATIVGILANRAVVSGEPQTIPSFG